MGTADQIAVVPLPAVADETRDVVPGGGGAAGIGERVEDRGAQTGGRLLGSDLALGERGGGEPGIGDPPIQLGPRTGVGLVEAPLHEGGLLGVEGVEGVELDLGIVGELGAVGEVVAAAGLGRIVGHRGSPPRHVRRRRSPSRIRDLTVGSAASSNSATSR